MNFLLHRTIAVLVARELCGRHEAEAVEACRAGACTRANQRRQRLPRSEPGFVAWVAAPALSLLCLNKHPHPIPAQLTRATSSRHSPSSFWQ